MPDPDTPNRPDPSDRAELRRRALSRWDNEGGAGPGRQPADALADTARPGDPILTNAELVQLQVRVIALENLVISLLAESSPRQLALAREMAAYISPRPGHTPHRLTLHAAAAMNGLVDRAAHFRAVTPPA